MTIYDFKVKNIKCGGCASTIESELTQITGVDEVTIDISSGRVSLNHQAASLEAINQKLSEIGFPLVTE